MLGRYQNGDTLVEVLFAITVFSLVVVGSLVIMNQGVAAAQRSIEISSVRHQIDAQAETLLFMHDSYSAARQAGTTFNLSDGVTSPAEEWQRMISSGSMVNSATAFNTNDASARRCQAIPSAGFVVDPVNVRFINSGGILTQSQTYSQLVYSGSVLSAARGIWIEAVRSAPVANNTGYIDFHIRACWDTVGMNVPMRIGTIVRLYDQR